MLSIVQSFELKWPLYVENYLNFFSSVGGGVSPQVLSIDCLLYHYEIDLIPLYVQTLFISILPFIIYFIAGGVFLTVYFMTKKPRGSSFIVVVIVVSIFLQHYIIKMLLDNLSWKTIENDDFLIRDMMVSCSSDSHRNWVSYIFFFYLWLKLF